MARLPRARPQSHIKASAQKPRKASCMHRLMPFLRRPLRADRLRGGLFPLRGPLRPDRRLSRFWTLLRNLTGRRLTGRLLTGRPLTGRLLTGDTFNYRKAYGKLRRDLLPFKGPFPLTGALTGRPPDGKAPYGEASYEKAPYELQESLRETTGRDFTRIGREFPLVCRRPKKVVFPRVVLFLDLLPFKGPFPLTGALTGRPPYGKASYGEASYRKAPYGEASYGKAPDGEVS